MCVCMCVRVRVSACACGVEGQCKFMYVCMVGHKITLWFIRGGGGSRPSMHFED